jgi:hypothetical protein
MNLSKLPFVEKIGISQQADKVLTLDYSESVLNHLQSVHAGAQYILVLIFSTPINVFLL